METKEKFTFIKWCENIWYYSKWMIILGGAVVIFLIIAVIQLISRKEPDVSFMYLGTDAITVVGTNKLESTVEELIDDYNADNEKNVDYLELTPAAGDSTSTLITRLQSEITAGDSVIYLIDQNYYPLVLKTGVLAKLSDVLGQDKPNDTVDEYGVYVKDLDISKLPGFSELPASTILCIRRSPEQDVTFSGISLESYNGNKQCFIKLVTY